MNNHEAIRYRLNLRKHLKDKPREKIASILQQVRAGGEYRQARYTVREARCGTIFDAAHIVKESRIGRTEALTPQQQAILWASEQLEQFRSTAPLDSDERRKIINRSATYLLGHTELFDVIAETWTNQLATSLVVDEKTPGFMEQMINATRHNAEGNWVGLKHERLAHVVKSLTSSDEAKPLAKSALQGYFQGPKNKLDIVRAYSRFGEATMDLFEHPEAFEKAVSIGNWREDDILSSRSKCYRDLKITSEMTIDNDDLLKQAYVADNIMLNMTILTKISSKEVVESGERFCSIDSEFKVDVEREFNRLCKKLDRSMVSKRLSDIRLLKTRPKSFLDSKEQSPEDFTSKWPAKLLFDRSFPLRARYEEEFGPLIAVRQYIAENVKPKYLNEGLGNVVHVPILLPNNCVLDIFVPESLQDKKVEIVKQFLKVENLQTPAYEGLASLVSLETGYLEFQDIQINYTTRLRSKLEKEHSMTMLEHVGFPMSQHEPDTNIHEVNQQKAQKILREQVRFLEPRRIRIPLANEHLTDLGLKHVDFSRISKSDNFQVDMCFVGQKYSIVLNENFQLDLEGKTFINRDLLESIHYTLLTLLEPLLTKETKNRGFSTTEKGAKKVTIRGRCMRELPKGHKFTQEAVDHYLEDEGKDLATRSSELQEVKGTRRIFTYVRPIVSDGDEELPPIVCHVPQEGLNNLK